MDVGQAALDRFQSAGSFVALDGDDWVDMCAAAAAPRPPCHENDGCRAPLA